MAAASLPFHRQPQQRPATGTWRRRTYLELGALRGAVPCARLHARNVLWEWGLSDLDEAVELVVSELVTNAIQASAGLGREVPGYDEDSQGLPCVWLWLASDGRQLVVEVGDSSPRAPMQAQTEHDVEGGRGLLLVGTVSRRWGYYFPAEEDDSQRKIIRKVVWALLNRT